MTHPLTNTHIPSDPLTLTKSKVEVLKDCPRAMHQAYILHAPEHASEILDRGIAGHAWMENVGNLLLRGETLSDEELYAEAVRLTALLHEPEREDMRGIARRMIRTGYLPIVPDGATDAAFEWAFAINTKLEPCDWSDPDVLYRSVIDLRYIEGLLGVVKDWKTSRVIARQWGQLRAYAWALSLHHPEITEVYGELHHIRFGRKGIVAAPVEVMDLERLHAEMPVELHALRTELARRLDNDEWEWRLSSRCAYCPHQPTCPPFMEKVLPLDIVEDLASAVMAANDVLLLEGQLKTARASMKAWVDAHGPVDVVPGEVYGYHETSSRKVPDARAAAVALKDHGLDPEAIWPAMKLGTTELRGLIRKVTAALPRGEKASGQAAIMAELEDDGVVLSVTGTTLKRKKITEEDGDE